jgi:hypothetical protein
MEDRDFIFLKSMWYALDKIEDGDLSMDIIFYASKAKEEVGILAFETSKFLFEGVEGLTVPMFTDINNLELVQTILQYFEYSHRNTQYLLPVKLVRLQYYMSLLNIAYVNELTKKH